MLGSSPDGRTNWGVESTESWVVYYTRVSEQAISKTRREKERKIEKKDRKEREKGERERESGRCGWDFTSQHRPCSSLTVFYE